MKKIVIISCGIIAIALTLALISYTQGEGLGVKIELNKSSEATSSNNITKTSAVTEPSEMVSFTTIVNGEVMDFYVIPEQKSKGYLND